MYGDIGVNFWRDENGNLILDKDEKPIVSETGQIGTIRSKFAPRVAHLQVRLRSQADAAAIDAAIAEKFKLTSELSTD